MGRDLANSFFAELHKSYLKPRGFTKQRRTFLREKEKYVERFRFDGSQWNSEDRPWTFYFDVGIEFKDLPRRHPDRDFPNTHAHACINWIVEGSPKTFEITEKNYLEMFQVINDLIDKASEELPRVANSIYAKCQAGQYIMPPELTRNSTVSPGGAR